MKYFYILLISAFTVILLSSCGTVEPVNDNKISVLEGIRLLDTLNAKFTELAAKPGSTPANTLSQTREWVTGLPNVSGASILDNYYMIIKLKSGLAVTYNIILIDEDGYSIFRGGGSKTNGLEKLDELQKRTVPSKKVLIYAPAYSEFYKPGELEKATSHFAKSKIKFDLTILKDKDCKPEIIQKFGDYGLVIIDTHGEPDAFMTGSYLNFLKTPSSEQDIIDRIKSTFGSDDIYKRIIGQELRMGASISSQIDTTKPNWIGNFYMGKLFATSKLIMNLPKLSNTIVFGNFCYSGYGVKPPDQYTENPIRTAFTNREPISYYGYTFDNNGSTTVTDGFAKKMEDTLIRNLVIDLDTTKNANLSHNNQEFYDVDMQKNDYLKRKLWFRHFNHDDYWFGGCVTEFIDERDGQKYKAVCIGKQNWMAENLRYNSPGSMCYDSSDANCEIYGRLYPFKLALAGSNASMTNPSGVQGICPKGWHIPSKAEWEQLFSNFATDTVARALKMKSNLWKNWVGETNSSGFGAIPGGFFTWTFNISTGNVRKFQFKGEHALFLSTSTDGQGKVYGVSIQSQSSKIVPFSITNEMDPNQPPMNASCRCVKD